MNLILYIILSKVQYIIKIFKLLLKNITESGLVPKMILYFLFYYYKNVK